VGYSAQQVRDLERLGVVPPTERAPNGYRRYHREHLIALQAYRALATAIGPVPARQVMPRLLTDSIDEVAETIDELHASLAAERTRVRAARRALDAILRETDAVFEDDDVMLIGELAEALGVRASALRHWEREGLIRPSRRASGNRSYEADAIAHARLVAVLREGGYPIPTIADVLHQLRARSSSADASRLLDARLANLTQRSTALLQAAGHLHGLLHHRAMSSLSITPADNRHEL
jgi:DNA-binding transcriptional MerR regulator